MNIILWDYESVWHDIWPQSKWRLLWPTFHGLMIFPYILKTVWCMNIILQDYESVWPDIWPQNKCRSLWPISHGEWFCLVSWRLVDAWTSYFGIMSQYDMAFDLKISVGHCDLYFMVQWFCLISWKVKDKQWSGTDTIRSHKTIWYMNTILWDYESVWPNVRPKNKCRSVTYFSWSNIFALYLKNY